GVVSVVGGPVTWINLKGYSADNLIVTRFGWLPDSNELYVLVQDRAQRWMDVLIADATTGEARRLFREKTKAWVPDPGKLHFLKDGTFLMRSDRDGWRHYYRFNTDGNLLNPVTQGEWEVRDLHAIDETNDWIYFSGTRFSHLASNVYRVKKDGSQLTRLTKGSSSHQANMSPTGKYFVDSYSDLQNPTQVGLRRGDGTFVRQLDNNPVPQLDGYELGAVELIDVPMRDGTKLPGIFIKPPDFDPNKKYPVWLRTYAGPHAFTVSNSWGRGRTRNHMLANLGIIVFEFDPRSASGRGPQSTWTAYRQLGLQELMDLEDAADALANQPFIDGSRIGIGGYSYGGFMASYALTHSKKFAAAFAGAPVTDWRNYDAFYTERYMDTPQENPDGYDLSSVVKAAGNLHGRLLVCHGAMDDNVHVQNTMQLSRALQKAGLDFDMMIYPRARHGIRSKHFYRLRHDFIRRNLLD
ncbi:MAG: prolyl oligopeptidase family serine peptidase, partial [Planctomycetota bacterium]